MGCRPGKASTSARYASPRTSKLRYWSNEAQAGDSSTTGSGRPEASASRAALALGLDPAAIQAALRSFPGLAHRMEEVRRRGKVLYVNDSKATNADSTAQALACFGDIYWIAGGQPKTGGIESLRQFFPRIRKAYLIGAAAQEFAATLADDVPHEIARTLDKALAVAARDAEASIAADPVVLLSPACASFDQYRNFEVRGDAFRSLVRALPGVNVRS